MSLWKTRDTPLIFPATRGGYIDLHNWRSREWIPAVRAAGFVDAEGKATKRIYDLRHTFATFAIHALVPSFIIARVMGTSEAMLRKHYGHLPPDTDDLVIERLNAYAAAENETFGHGEGHGRRGPVIARNPQSQARSEAL